MKIDNSFLSMDEGLGDRIFDFVVRVIKYCRTLPRSSEYKVIKYQLIKAATSCGANYEEAQGSISKADFFNKINITLKEMRESNYWLRILAVIHKKNEELDALVSESTELKKILGSISSKRVRYK